MAQTQGKKHWRVRYRPYIVAVTLAIVMTMLVMPEVMDGDVMEPTMEDGTILVCTKTSYSQKRGFPEMDQVVILEKKATKGVFEDNLIGRIAGLPGDTLEIKDNKLYRNGEVLREGSEIIDLGNDQKITLGKEEVFLLGDNDSGKMDSRNQKIGAVDMDYIKGNVKWAIWPVSQFGKVE